MTKKGDKLTNLRVRIRRMLVDAGTYKKDMAWQIELTARNLLIYRRLYEEILQDPDTVIVEQARDGVRHKINPLFGECKRWGDLVQKNLRALGLNKDYKPTADGDSADDGPDAMTTLMASMADTDEDDEDDDKGDEL